MYKYSCIHIQVREFDHMKRGSGFDREKGVSEIAK
jgi:hypothetical protein